MGRNRTSKSISRRRALLTLITVPPVVLGLSSLEDVPQHPLSSSKPGALTIAMLSFWHVHAHDYEHQALNNPASQVIAVWDEDQGRGRTEAAALGVPFYDQLGDLLARTDIHAVIVDAPTTMHRAVMVAAAQAGKHIFTEKTLAPTLHEANEIVAAVEKAGVRLMVSLPRLYSGSTLAIKSILDRQLLGQLTQVRTRLTHDGALRTGGNPNGWLPPAFFDPQQTAGGALIDLGAHPLYLANLFLGLPESVSASYGYITGRAVEDNATVTLRYPDGKLGIVETSFVNPLSPFTIEAHGTAGSLLFGTPDGSILLRSTRAGRPYDVKWSSWPNVPPDQPLAFQQWLTHIHQGNNATDNVRAAVELSMLMEAANLSAKSGRIVLLNELKR